MDDEARIAAICAEIRAAELVHALRHALAGAPHWRWEARRLLTMIDAGELPERHQAAAFSTTRRLPRRFEVVA